MSTHTKKRTHFHLHADIHLTHDSRARASQFVCVLFRGHSNKAFLHFAQMHTSKITCRNMLLVCGFVVEEKLANQYESVVWLIIKRYINMSLVLLRTNKIYHNA